MLGTKLLNIYRAFQFLIVGLLLLAVSGFLFISIQKAQQEADSNEELQAIPNYNYIPDIKQLRADGKLSEALEMSRFVIRHTDMPGQEEARKLEAEIEKEVTSVCGRAKRATKGFVLGSGDSIEELTGGIASDMLLYGDCRDLIKQGYYKITGKETDPVIAALAGVGLLTEAFDFADWAPAVLKAFRKIGALSRKFADFLVTACRKSAKAKKLDGALKATFKSLRSLTEKLGLARAAAIFRHIDSADDLAAISKVADKSADAAYFTVKNGGADGVGIIKRLGDTDDAITAMNKAAKKGPAGIAWLKKGGKGRKHLLKVRYGARILKTLRLERPQQLVEELLKLHPDLIKVAWALIFLTAAGAVFSLVECGLKLRPAPYAQPDVMHRDD